MITNMQWNSKAVGIIAVAGVVILYAGYNMWRSDGEASGGAVGGASRHEKSAAVSGPATFANVHMSGLRMDTVLPAGLGDDKEEKAVQIAEKEIKIEISPGKPTVTVFYREAAGNADKVPLLLLHGAKFTSENWVKTKTIQFASKLGHRVVAVDLPGYGKSVGKVADKGKFIDTLIGVTGLGSPVIVSPSMSGKFSLPFVLGHYTHKPAGFIPVAPGTTSAHEAAEYKKCQVPVLIVYGSKDESMGVKSAADLKNFPNHQEHVIEGAGHPAYIDKPAEWHRLLYNFLQAFKRQ